MTVKYSNYDWYSYGLRLFLVTSLLCMYSDIKLSSEGCGGKWHFHEAVLMTWSLVQILETVTNHTKQRGRSPRRASCPVTSVSTSVLEEKSWCAHATKCTNIIFNFTTFNFLQLRL